MADVRREVAILLAGAALGALATEVIDAFQDDSPALIVTVASLAILIGLVVVSIRLVGPLHLVIRGRSGILLQGDWHGYFTYTKLGSDVTVHERLAIRQRGGYLEGESRSTRVDGDFPLESTGYAFKASLRQDGILDGTWHNTVPGQRFHGSFQGRARRDGKRIVGTWIGVDELGINRGTFEWTRGSG